MKFECPKCNSQLMYREEYYEIVARTINKRTGELNKKKKVIHAGDSGLMFITCINGDCKFGAYEIYPSAKQIKDLLDNYDYYSPTRAF